MGKVLGVAAAVLLLVVVAGAVLYRPDIPYERLEAKYAVPASKFVDLPGGVRLHYREDGDPAKPTVVLVHGFGDSFVTWGRWVVLLKRDFHVITLDLPGHGLTRAPAGYRASPDAYADLVDAFAAKLALPPFAIVGNSLGGGVAWQVAQRYPKRVDALVLMDASGWPPAPTTTRPPLVFRLLKTPAGAFWLRHFNGDALAAQALRADVVRQQLITKAFVARWQELHRAPGHRDILMGLKAGPHSRATAAALSAIAVPTLVLQGEQDVVIPAADGRRFAQAIPGATLILYPDAGHLPQVDIPDRSAADVAAFLKAALAKESAKGPA